MFPRFHIHEPGTVSAIWPGSFYLLSEDHMFTKADKAIAGGVGGAIAVLANWALINFAGLEMGVDELSALAIVVGAVISAGLVYFVPNKK